MKVCISQILNNWQCLNIAYESRRYFYSLSHLLILYDDDFFYTITSLLIAKESKRFKKKRNVWAWMLSFCLNNGRLMFSRKSYDLQINLCIYYQILKFTLHLAVPNFHIKSFIVMSIFAIHSIGCENKFILRFIFNFFYKNMKC